MKIPPLVHCGRILTPFLLWALAGASEAEEVMPQVLERIAFGSCASQNKPQPIWDGIVKVKPDVYLAMGDNIYGDTTDMEVLKGKYSELGAKPGYQALRKICPILATWDDHDYGVNDGGAGYSRKVQSQQAMLDFFMVPAESPRRKRPGIYESWRFGPEGKRVQIILLDTRYFRSRALKDTRPAEEKAKLNLVGWYLPDPDPDKTILGPAQWEWLEEQLKLPADLRIIGSSTQVIAGEKGMESWGCFPEERKRLYRLIGSTGAQGVIFISGDVHFSEISRTTEGAYPFYDFTSSGLTNSHAGWAAAMNPHRISARAYAEPNFGLLRIGWATSPPTVTMEVHGLSGEIPITRTISLGELK